MEPRAAPPAWVYDRVELRYRPPGPGMPSGQARATDDHEALSRLLVRQLAGLPLTGALALDVGTGRGRLAFLLAASAARVVGVDRDAAALAEARREAAERGLAGRVSFVEADVERPGTDYRRLAGGVPDLVSAHLCLSDAILAHAARAIGPEGRVAVAGFHADQWRETGVRSRFAYDEPGLERALAAAGLVPRFLGAERVVVEFEGPEAALRYLADSGLDRRFGASDRLAGFRAHLASGGRRLTTQARVVALAEPGGARGTAQPRA